MVETAKSPASDEALRAIALNVARHLDDAFQLLGIGRTPSATASAILAAEELGKLVLQMSSAAILPLPKKLHAAHGRLLVSLVQILENSGWETEWARFRDEDIAVASIEPNYVLRMKEHPEYAEFLRKVDAGELTDAHQRRSAWVEATTAKMTREITGWVAGRITISNRTKILLSEGLQRLRLKATFVDVDRSGEIANDPRSLCEDVPRGLCLAVTDLFVAVVKMVDHYRPSLSLTDIDVERWSNQNSVDVHTRSRLFGVVMDVATR